MPQRTIELRAGDLAEEDLLVEHVMGREGLSEAYAFEVAFQAVNGEAIDLASLRGADALLTLRGAGDTERHVHGILWSASMGEVVAGRPRYRARLVPRLQLLALVHASRVFQSLSTLEIVAQVLDAAGVQHRSALSGSYPPREYCVQYRESDLHFVLRLLAEDGIFFAFEHGPDGHVLVLHDGASTCPELAGGGDLPYRPPAPSGKWGDFELLDRVAHGHSVAAGKVTVRGFDFERPEMPVDGASRADDPLRIEHYEWPDGFVDPRAGTRVAAARLQERRIETEQIVGEGTCVRLVPGATCRVIDHPSAALEQELLLVRVRHDARQWAGAGQARPDETYRGAFVAVPAAAPIRPRRVHARPVAFTETATVVGPAGEEIHVDAHGRVKIQFQWDREGRKNDRASCWVRLAQRWAGTAWGASFVPRIGQEVLVRFQDGDPDQPLVIGAVYNGDHATPLALPEEKTRSTLRSQTSPSDEGGSNELRFEDAKAAEQIHLHAQRNDRIVVENDKAQSVYADEALEVDKDRSRTVGGNQTLRVGVVDASKVDGNQTTVVTGDRKTRVAASHTERVGGRQSVSVAKLQQVEVAKATAVQVGAGAALTVGGAYAVTVGGVHNIAVGGARLEQTGGLKAVGIGAHAEQRVGKSAEARVAADEQLSVGGVAELAVKKDLADEVGGRATLQVTGPTGFLAKSIQLEAQQKLKITVGGKLLLEVQSSGAVQVNGSTATVTASGPVALKGASVSKTSGAATSGAAQKGKDQEKAKKATIKAKWSKTEVLPRYRNVAGAIPDVCKVSLNVDLTNVPDGTKGVILVCHCASGSMVKNGRIPCQVSGGKLVDAKTKKAPEFSFGPEQTPWDPHDQPFFFFKVSIQHQGLRFATPADLKDGGQALRVKYYHVCVGDHWADVGGLTTGAEASEIEGILSAVPHSEAHAAMAAEPSPTFAAWSRRMLGTYAYHHGSHGTCEDRITKAFISVRPPPRGHGDPPQCPVGNWRSVVVLSGASASDTDAVLGDDELRDEKTFPEVPRYLAYLDCCLAGWEPSLGRAFRARGTQYVIAFRRTIPDGDARDMARRFHRKWAQTHKLDPAKIRDLFFEVGAPFFGTMRPVLIGWRWEPILDPAAGPVQKAVAAIHTTFGGIAASIGELFK